MIRRLLNSFQKYLPLILIVAIGLALRLFDLERRVPFDADQEELAFRASEILGGHPALLGPKTSVGGFSIGPGFEYLWAGASIFFRGAPISGAYLSVLLGIATILGFYFIGRNLFDKKTGLILAFIIAVSANTVAWDQAPWAPSLFYISQLILFYGAYLSTKDKHGILFVALGFALGYQSHFGIFLSFLAVAVYWIFFRSKTTKKYLLFSAAAVFFGLLPNILFDLIHGFANIKRLLGVFGESPSGYGASLGKLFSSLTYSNISVLYPYPERTAASIAFAALIVAGLAFYLKNKKDRSFLLLTLLSITIPFATFVFYSSNFSEYYLMMTIPPFMFLAGYFVHKLKGKWVCLLPLILIVLGYFNVRAALANKRVINLWAKEQAVALIKGKSGESGYGISLTTAPGQYFGFKYLFDYYGIKADVPPKPGQKVIYTIVVPDGAYGIYGIKSFDGIGVRWEGVR
ncbi:MAG TPA: glycosyltransferase family 39 protein [Patescibacteria group bacterium]|nr:glycosyltransferase family 39 protein [Patescibacteria group bacterium]